MTVNALAVTHPGAPFSTYRYEAGDLGADEVDVRVTHAGVCHTDVGMIDDEYGISRFPVVAGHESVGIVEALGSDVDPAHLRVGDRVGVGPIAGSCMRCELCRTGRMQVCPNRDDTVMRGDRGGFASHVRASHWQHVYKIPDALSSAEAAPLLCAGSTVFAPLLRHRVSPTDRVAVVGIGGLGHLAVQFLASWGCEVTAISRTREKEADARRLGAAHFVASGEAGAMESVQNSFDVVLSTVSASLPWDDYLNALRPMGILSIVGVPPEDLRFSPVSLLMQAKTVAGGVPCSIEDTRAMLDYAARHGVRPVVQEFPAEQADAAVDLVRTGQAHYRAVIAL
ncbi:NAD(P)-dependent alcohol dehydrogenase [Kribbella sp. NPDC056861]|uniref:NAD(P)-dependent alcohol dehydrogenase n=1 Tax=Kribbella sp. NPDC056861 TaxID=3154857 RepID=UPI00343D6875